MWKKNWHSNKYINFVKDIINPKFLIDLITPRDIFSIIKTLNIKKSEEQVYRFVIACAVFNGILIGMPGMVGIGVILAQAVEVVMAFQIAKMVGLLKWNDIFSISKLKKLIAAIGITTFSIMYGFLLISNTLLEGLKLLSLGTAMPLVAVSVIATTIFYGMFLYLSFIELKNYKTLKKLSFATVGRISINAFKFTAGISKSLVRLLIKDLPGLTKQIGQNIKDAFDVNIVFKKKLKGEFFFAGSLAYLLQGKFNELNGPFAKLYLEAWKLSLPNKLPPDASPEDIKSIAESYNAEELFRVQNNVNSKFFEVLEVTKENADGDVWSAELIKDQNNPASDAIFTNNQTGETIEVNYKFSTNKHYIESHIQEHPDVPVIVPKDIEEKINSPFASHYEQDAVLEISEKNFEQMLNQYSNIDLAVGVTAAGAASLTVRLLPFFVAYYRGKINREQFGQALKRFFPDIAARTINRIGMLTFFGPLYGLFLLAGFGMKGTLYGFDDKNETTFQEEDKLEEKKEGIFEKKFSRRSLFTLSYLKDF
jgi:hypothetical protein